MIEIRQVSAMDAQVGELIAELDAYQLSIYPEESNHLDPAEALDNVDVYFVGAFHDNELVGIGAIKYMSDDGVYGEIKRVYVCESGRGHGVSKKIMENLEDNAAQKGVDVFRLETGIHQPEAIGLYEKFGYKKRVRFGDYANDPLSVFMEKSLEIDHV